MKKRLTAAAVITALAMCSGFSAAAEQPNGDVDMDGGVSVADAVLLTKYLLAAEPLTAAQYTSADMNADSCVNAFDLAVLKRKLLTLEVPQENVIYVSTIDEIFAAVRNAQPGDVITIAPGTYDYTVYQGAQKIDTAAEGTETAPITLTAADPENPPILTGANMENGYVLQVTGDYWIIENIHFTNSQKGIVLDNSNYSIIRNCTVSDTGAEAIALRDGSCYCLVQNCEIYNTGTVTPGYGEGIYIGSAKSTTGFDYNCSYNVVDGCTFKNVAAEHVDVKEYTTGTEIKNCTFYGDGMTGANYAGSFVDIAGNACNVHDNVGYRNGNENIVAAFEIHEQVEGYGYDCIFRDNTLYMDQEYGVPDPSRRMYVVDGWFANFTVSSNQVDYGSGLIEAQAEHYNSDYVTFE